MVVSSFSDPIALVCPPMVRPKRRGFEAFEALKAYRASNARRAGGVFEEQVRHGLLCVAGTPLHLHPTALGQVSSASPAAGRSLAARRRLHALPPGGVGLPRTCLALKRRRRV